MIIFIYGTTAEAIKVSPVVRRLMARGVPFRQWLTYQHTAALQQVIGELGMPAPDLAIANGPDAEPLRSKGDVLKWLFGVARWMVRNVRRVRKSLPSDSLVVVHGDTMTTVVGAFIAKRLGVPCAHIEAGLRSGDWRNPFPEELDRRIVGRMANIHYAPTPSAVAALAGRPNVIDTKYNTVVDAVLDQVGEVEAPDSPYGVILLHRYEFISNAAMVASTIKALAEASPVRLRILGDAFNEQVLKEAIAKYGEGRFVLESKLPHVAFIKLAQSAEFLITDSGGIQQEAGLLGVPTLIHRVTTESEDGIGRNVVLSEWNIGKLRRFLAEYPSLRHQLKQLDASPADIIVADLEQRGYAGGAA